MTSERSPSRFSGVAVLLTTPLVAMAMLIAAFVVQYGPTLFSVLLAAAFCGLLAALVAALGAVVAPRRLRRASRVAILALLLSAVMSGLLLLAGPHGEDPHIENSDRLAAGAAAMAAVAVAIALATRERAMR